MSHKHNLENSVWAFWLTSRMPKSSLPTLLPIISGKEIGELGYDAGLSFVNDPRSRKVLTQNLISEEMDPVSFKDIKNDDNP